MKFYHIQTHIDSASYSQSFEEEMKQIKHTLTTNSLTKHGITSEINDLVRSRTELDCVVEDLKAARERTGGKREALEAELDRVRSEIEQKEHELAALAPQWDKHRTRESDERRKLDEARAHLDTLYEKQGRLSRFRTRGERDAYLNNEIASLRAYQATQTASLEAAQRDLERARASVGDLAGRTDGVQNKLEERRERVKQITEELSGVKEKHSELIEKRKEMWREDARLTNTVSHAENELRQHERELASMMDKDTGSGLRAIDRIAERHKLKGVYGPLYRLFEVTDKKYSTAVELTAGNR